MAENNVWMMKKWFEPFEQHIFPCYSTNPDFYQEKQVLLYLWGPERTLRKNWDLSISNQCFINIYSILSQHQLSHNKYSIDPQWNLNLPWNHQYFLNKISMLSCFSFQVFIFKIIPLLNFTVLIKCREYIDKVIFVILQDAEAYQQLIGHW